jgi:hypothetical protein
VSQNNIDQSQAAETQTEETRTFIRQARAATRSKCPVRQYPHLPEDDVLNGRREGILIIRSEMKTPTLQWRQSYNRQRRESSNAATSP